MVDQVVPIAHHPRCRDASGVQAVELHRHTVLLDSTAHRTKGLFRILQLGVSHVLDLDLDVTRVQECAGADTLAVPIHFLCPQPPVAEGQLPVRARLGFLQHLVECGADGGLIALTNTEHFFEVHVAWHRERAEARVDCAGCDVRLCHADDLLGRAVRVLQQHMVCLGRQFFTHAGEVELYGRAIAEPTVTVANTRPRAQRQVCGCVGTEHTLCPRPKAHPHATRLKPRNGLGHCGCSLLRACRLHGGRHVGFLGLQLGRTMHGLVRCNAAVDLREDTLSEHAVALGHARQELHAHAGLPSGLSLADCLVDGADGCQMLRQHGAIGAAGLTQSGAQHFTRTLEPTFHAVQA